jgi:capsular polysaccharide transport system permease protein
MDRDEQLKPRKLLVAREKTSVRPLLSVSIVRGSHIARRVLGDTLRRIIEDDGAKSESQKRIALPRPPLYLLSFVLLVVAPSLLSVIYWVFIASDQYVAETRFSVRAAQVDRGHDNVASLLSSLGSGNAPSLAGQEPYMVTSYIRSRAIVEDLSRTLDLQRIFRRPEADFWARLKRNASAEELTSYWNGMITTYVDAQSGIVTVEVRAFRPEDALAVSQGIIQVSERLVNDVSSRARNDAMRRAEVEVRRYEAAVRQALLDLRKYRDTEGFIDPVSAATSTSQLLMQAMAEKIQIQNDFFVASKAMSSDAPAIQMLKSRLENLDTQIEELKSKLTGNSPEGRTVAASLVKFEELELKRIFAEKLYTMAQDALERARLRAEQQNVYVSVFVQPSLPQDASYPERLNFSLLIPIGLLVFWGILALTAAAIEDHRL